MFFFCFLIFVFILFCLSFNVVKQLNLNEEQGMGIEICSLIHSCIHLTNTLLSPAYMPGTILGVGNIEVNKAEKNLMVSNLYSNRGVGHLTSKSNIQL